jgi:hypothetical protein
VSFSGSEETLHEIQRRKTWHYLVKATLKLDTAEKWTFEMTLLPGWSGL